MAPTDNTKQISTLSRKAYENLKDRYGQNVADAVFYCSYESGRSILMKLYLNKIREELEIRGDMERIREIILEAEILMGMHERISQLMQSEVGYFGSMVPLDFGKERLRLDDFCDLYFKKIAYPGSHVLIKGWKGGGKTNLALVFADYARRRGYAVAMNVPLIHSDERYDDVYEIYRMSDLLQLRVELPADTPMLFIMDEADQTWARILGTTKEHKNLNKFENLTRHYNIAVVSVWHVEKDIPEPLIKQVDDGKATLIVKTRKDTATTRGIVDCHITHIPRSPIEYMSTGERSAQTVYMDVDITAMTRKLAGVQDDKKARDILRRAIHDQSIIMEDYKEMEGEKKLISDVMLEVIDNFKDFISPTDRTVDWRAVMNAKRIGENDAKLVKDEIMRQIKKIWADFKGNNLSEIPDDVLKKIRGAIEEKYL